ncbi:MAG: HAD-IA family hydrolase [Porticoccaceae bacterium]|nr:HAD-IA family hydrolase [Porticoccaceae bacterium]
MFDWDGTLCDSVARIAHCIQLAAADNDLTIPSRKEASHIIGLGLPEATRYLFPALNDQQSAEFTASYSARFRQHDNDPCALFDGVLETLQTLKIEGYLLAVATGKSRAGLNRVLDGLDLATFFHATRCADETLSKPNPLMLNQLLSELSVAPTDAIMVGDTEFDLEMARGAGIRSIGLTYGAHSLKRLTSCDPIACIDSFPQIKNYL